MISLSIKKREEGRNGHNSLFKYMKNAWYWVLESPLDPYWLHLTYFVGISILGFILLHLSHTKSHRFLNQLDAFYTSVSAVTVSSLGSVRMQEFSDYQLVVITILMLVGGEVFTSVLCLHLRRLSAMNKQNISESDVQHRELKIDITGEGNLNSYCMDHDTETNSEKIDQFMKPCNDHNYYNEMEQSQDMTSDSENIIVEEDLKNRALILLSYITLGYLVVVQLVGIIVTVLCFYFSPGRKHILNSRDVKMSTFSVFTIVSSFANCGFIPLDDNMMPFRKDSVLLFTVALQVLLGNTMYAPCLRAIIWTLRRFSRSDGPNRRFYDYILQDGYSRKLYDHLFPTSLSLWLVIAGVGFFTAQIALTCALHWSSKALDGLDTWEKLVAAGFQSVAIRHAGETVLNPQLLSSAVIVMYIVMMYLPPYPVYFSDREGDVMKVKRPPSKKAWKGNFCKQVQVCHSDERSIGFQLEKLLFHDSCYLIIAVIVICITESDSISNDPLNYKIVNIVFEVVSAYGNVGISMGYSCSLFRKLIIHSEAHCEEVAYSFSGKWSSKGKVVILLVMFLGRLKGIKRNSGVFRNFTAKIRRHIQRQLKIIKKTVTAWTSRLSDQDSDHSKYKFSHGAIKGLTDSPRNGMTSIGQGIRRDCKSGYEIEESTVQL